MSDSVERIRVLESFAEPRGTTNPYVKMLASAVQAQPGVELLYFSWRTALIGRYDVFHVHWPEMLMGGHRPLGRGVRRTLTTLLCLRLLLTRTPVVRTWHNLHRPSGLARIDHLLLHVFDRLTVLRIRLNDSGPMPVDSPFVTILHGDYRDWYASFPQPEAHPGRSVFVGLIRRYKGVEQLLEAFEGVQDPDLSLYVAGHPSTEELRGVVSDLVRSDARVTASLQFLDDGEYVAAVAGAELVVLPYRHMHNSGSVLAALSLGRPVLVPDNEVNRRLADEVGPGWVHLYQDEIDSGDLVAAFASMRRTPLTGSPDLSLRTWEATGVEHVRAFRRALSRDAGSRP